MNGKKFKIFFGIIFSSIFSFSIIYYVFSLVPQDLSNKVFFFDAQDIDATGNNLNELSDGAALTGWVDKFGGILAFQNEIWKAPLYVLTSINSYPSIYFGGDKLLNILENWNISLSGYYPQKSFVMIIKTSGDLSGVQTIYDEGTSEKGFSIQLISGHILGGVWNFVDWTGNKIFSLDMGAVSGNSIYTLVLVFDSLRETLAGYIDGKLVGLITGLTYYQTNHGACRFNTSFGCALFSSGGSFAIGSIKNDGINLFSQTGINAFEGYGFKGYIGEIQTYNYALTEDEVSGITLYLFEKWGIDNISPIITGANILSGSLLPGQNHILELSYNDNHLGSVGIDTGSARLNIWKWQSGYGWNLYNSDLPYLVISTGGVRYNINLPFGKYLLDFKIADRAGNYASRKAQIRIDEPKLIIFTGSVSFDDLMLGENLSSPIVVNVHTVGAPFKVYIIKQEDLSYDGVILPDYSGGVGWGLSWGTGIYPLYVSKLIMSGSKNINDEGLLNIYSGTFYLKSLINEVQSAGDYSGFIRFDILLSY